MLLVDLLLICLCNLLIITFDILFWNNLLIAYAKTFDLMLIAHCSKCKSYVPLNNCHDKFAFIQLLIGDSVSRSFR